MSEVRSILARLDRGEITAEEASDLLQQYERERETCLDRVLNWLVG